MCKTIVSTAIILAWMAAIAASADEALFATRIATDLDRPVYATFAPGQPEQLYILEQHTGHVKTMDLTNGSVSPDPFLTVPRVSNGNEQGLLGLAFHPNFETNGQLYVNYTEANGRTNVRQYTATDDRTSVDPDSATTVLRFAQPQSNHNGGWIGFSPIDQFLYISTGDGGGANDQGNGHTSATGNSQDITNNLLGKDVGHRH